jgi:DNA-directed RNA polymerase subunit beta'
VTGITKSPAGGFDITVGGAGGDSHYVPHGRDLNVKVGDEVKKGDQLSSGVADPRELLELTNMDRVQRYMVDEVDKVYAAEGIKRRNIEVVIRSLTNLGVVDDPGDVGDDNGIIRGDHMSLSAVNDMNNKRAKGTKPIEVIPVLRGVDTLPLDQTTDWLARLQYRKLRDTFIGAASEGWKSDIHGVHPAPGIIYSAEFGQGKTTGKERTPY